MFGGWLFLLPMGWPSPGWCADVSHAWNRLRNGQAGTDNRCNRLVR